MEAQTLFEIALGAVAIFVTVVGIAVTIYISAANSVDKKIEDKIKDPVFLEEVAKRINFPVIVFDEKESVLFKNDPDKNFKNFSVKKDNNGNIESIIIEPDTVISSPPILETINTDLFFTEAKKQQQYSWVFYPIESEIYHIVMEKPEEEKPSKIEQPVKKFKVTLLR